jgi:hypothetical protein
MRRSSAWFTCNTDHNIQQKKSGDPGARGFHVPRLHALKCGHLESSIILTAVTLLAHTLYTLQWHIMYSNISTRLSYTQQIHSMATPVMHTYSGIIKCTRIGWHLIQCNNAMIAIVWSMMRSLLRRKVSFPLFFSNNCARKKNCCWL